MTPIGPSLTVADPDALHDTIARHVAGTTTLTGLDLYYALERSTSLLAFHTMLRRGERNRTHDGLQQSYGDHNRLLMLALDRLLIGDVDWLRAHVSPSETIDEEALAACARTGRGLGLSPDAQVALWLGAALHDCGMLDGQTAHVDVEDGLALARPMIDALCPRATAPVAMFALRHHDYVKDTFLGEAPVALVADDLARLDTDLHDLALTALGLIQVAGASSLGTGRLTNFRLRVFEACTHGTALRDRTPERRLGRLLSPAPEHDPSPPPADVDGLAGFLDRVSLHGWHTSAGVADTETRLAALHRLAAHNAAWQTDHLVITAALDDLADERATAEPPTRVHVARSGSRIVTVLPPAPAE